MEPDKAMLDIMIIEQRNDGKMQGRGTFTFSLMPRIGEHILIPEISPSRDFYKVISIEHGPVRLEAERSPLARSIPYVWLYVEHSYDEDEYGAG